MGEAAEYTVGAAEIEAFERDGAIILRGIIGPDWLGRLAAAIERDIARPGPFHHGYSAPEGGRFHGNMRLWESDPDFRDYCLHSPLPPLAARLLRTDKVNLFYDQLFVKEPGTSQPTRWHNDQPYWPVKGWPVMSFWLALDPVTKESGAVEFVRGSHRWNRWFQAEPFAPGGNIYERNPDYESMPDLDAERARLDIVSWDMMPGDVLAFHALSVHGAGGNLTGDRRRRGYTVRYCGRDAVYYDGPGSHPGLRNPLLRSGDALDSDQYPVVWRNA